MQEQDTQNKQANQKPAQVSMTLQVITIYCTCDDFLQAAGWHDDPQAQMTNADRLSLSQPDSLCLEPIALDHEL